MASRSSQKRGRGAPSRASAFRDRRAEAGEEPEDELLQMMASVGTQVGRVIEGRRALHELAEASQLFHIARDAVVNADNHGVPGSIVIRLRRVERGLRLEVEDDGKGPPGGRRSGRSPAAACRTSPTLRRAAAGAAGDRRRPDGVSRGGAVLSRLGEVGEARSGFLATVLGKAPESARVLALRPTGVSA